MTYSEIRLKFVGIQGMLKELDQEYIGKIKGELYIKRKHQLIKQLDTYKQKALSVGFMGGSICKVTGVRRRPHKKNPKLFIEEKFTIYFTGVDGNEITTLIKLHVKDYITFKIQYFKPGIIFSS